MLLTVMNHANLLREVLTEGSSTSTWVNECRRPPLFYAIEKGMGMMQVSANRKKTKMVFSHFKVDKRVPLTPLFYAIEKGITV